MYWFWIAYGGVLILHWFSTVHMADWIVMLQDGKIHELGSHEALLSRNGVYVHLFNLQAEGYRQIGNFNYELPNFKRNLLI